jgi:hypothetical protein
MVHRLIAIHLAALHVIVCCSWSSAATSLVIAELEAKRAIAEADAAQANAEKELAAWKLSQSKALRSRGHASWQDVAEQEVSAKSATASAQASAQYHQAVLEWQARLAKSNLQPTLKESESVKLYMPRSARLVAWIPTEVATHDLSERHLKNLRMEYQSVANIDLSSLEASTKSAEREVAYRRTENDADLMRGAILRLRLAKAEYESARTRKEKAAIIARRMALISESLEKSQADTEESPAISQLGTRFVDATSDGELTRLTVAMATDNRSVNKKLAWLKLQRDAVSDKIESLEDLSNHFGADDRELGDAKKKKTDLELQIRHAQDVLKLRQQIASDYERTSKTRPTESIESAESTPLDVAWFADADIVRHLLELQQLKLQREAKLAAATAQHDYLVERLRRVERIPEDSRPPKELDDLRHKVQAAQQQLAIADGDLVLLDREQQRFCRQVESQRGDQYQLVQADHGEFISREQFEIGARLIAAVGFVGQGGLSPKLPTMCPYIESPTVLRCMSQLRVQALDTTTQIDGRAGFELGHDDPQQSGELIGETHLTSYGLRWGECDFTFSSDRFCYRPFSLRRVHLDHRWAPYDCWRSTSVYQCRSFGNYEPYSFGFCGQSIFWHPVYCPTRLYPCRRSYQTAYPTWGNIYSPAYASPLSAYRGFRYSSGLGCCCFD